VYAVPFEGAERWLQLSVFSHAAHLTEDCQTCHAAEQAGSAQAVLVPGIEVCRDCHGGTTPVLGKVTSPCTQCHGMHMDEYGPMRHPDAPATADTGRRS
jgi:predicted CXXCH cytochrome family protein